MRRLAHYRILAYAYYATWAVAPRRFRASVYGVVLFDHAEPGLLAECQ